MLCVSLASFRFGLWCCCWCWVLVQGALISFPGTIGIWLPFIIGSIENRWRNGGTALLTIRKRFSMLGSITQAASAVLFVLAPTPLLACAANCCQYIGMSFHGSGFSANYLEVGGKVRCADVLRYVALHNHTRHSDTSPAVSVVLCCAALYSSDTLP